MNSPQTWKVKFTGRVQGVGFRFSVLEMARAYPVVGYVKNCMDGSVEMVARGQPEILVQFCEQIKQNSPGNIEQTDIDRHWQSVQELSSFQIAR